MKLMKLYQPGNCEQMNGPAILACKPGETPEQAVARAYGEGVSIARAARLTFLAEGRGLLVLPRVEADKVLSARSRSSVL